MKVTQILITSITMLGFFSSALAAPSPNGGTPPPDSKHWGIECGHPASKETCKKFLVACDGKHADWKPQVTTQCFDKCECVEHGGTPPPPYGKDHPPQIPPIRPVSPLNLNSKAKGKGKGKREVQYFAYRRDVL